MENFCFVGHTHFAGVFLPDPDFYSPKELGEHFALNSFERAIINVGSVGQPRDRDPRACFVTVSDKEVEFVRIEYDIPKTVDKIRAVEELDDFQGERLLEGR
jgi:diadenosine tetraphosphatase ApaH/serine/threonine PP2A family protein phosphatase